MSRRVSRRVIAERRAMMLRARAAQSRAATGAAQAAVPAEGEPSEDDSADDSVSGLVRQSPLPVGRYWVDIPASKQAEFDGYLQGNERIRVEVTEGGGDEGTFYVFRVLQPVPWFAVNFGFPNTAGPEVKSRADTVQAPDLPKDGVDQIDDALHSGGALGGLVMGLAMVAGVVYLGGKLIEQRGKRKG